MNFLGLALTAALVSEVQGSVQDSASIGPAADRPLAYALKRLFAIGGTNGSVVELGTLHPQDITGAAGARLVLIDRLEFQVVVVSPGGVLERRAGRRGQGPGELSFPGLIASDPGGLVAVWDLGRRTLLRFDANGALARETLLSDIGLVQEMRILGPDELIFSRGRQDSLLLFRRRGNATTVVAAIGRSLPRTLENPGCGLTDLPVRAIFAPSLLWDHRAGLTVVNTDGSFAISFHPDGDSAWVARRAAVRRRSTSALARASLGTGPTVSVGAGRPCPIPTDRILAVAEVAPTLPAYARLLIAPDSSVWAIRYHLPSEPRSADVYTSSKGYLGTVTLGPANPVGFRTDGAVISLEADADEVPLIVVYQVLKPS